MLHNGLKGTVSKKKKLFRLWTNFFEIWHSYVKFDGETFLLV